MLHNKTKIMKRNAEYTIQQRLCSYAEFSHTVDISFDLTFANLNLI